MEIPSIDSSTLRRTLNWQSVFPGLRKQGFESCRGIRRPHSEGSRSRAPKPERFRQDSHRLSCRISCWRQLRRHWTWIWFHEYQFHVQCFVPSIFLRQQGMGAARRTWFPTSIGQRQCRRQSVSRYPELKCWRWLESPTRRARHQDRQAARVCERHTLGSGHSGTPLCRPTAINYSSPLELPNSQYWLRDRDSWSTHDLPNVI